MDTQDLKFCMWCGAQIPGAARFCPACGKSQQIATPANPAQSGDTSLIDQRESKPTAGTHPLIPKRLMQPGTQVGGHYIIKDVIGEGGMGVVYLAHDEVRDRQVAIKSLHVNLMGDSGIRKRFYREARLMTEWSHPNVVSVFSIIEHDDLLAYVMEFIDGETLEDYLQKWGGQLPYEDVQFIFGGVLKAMQTAHDRGIVHRDLKPQNILIEVRDDGLIPHVVDFGIAKVIEGTQYTMTGALLGSSHFMSPEQVQDNQSVDQRSDIYSLGVSMYYSITGRCPFEGGNQFGVMIAHVHQAPELPGQYRPKLPLELERLVMDCLAKAPKDRPQSCEEVLTRLEAALKHVTPTRRSKNAAPLPPTLEEPDGTKLILVPSGGMLMGPSRRDVYIDEYYLAQAPVTNRQFQAFIDATHYQPDDAEAQRFLSHWRDGKSPKAILDHPVVFVSWFDARAYCRWSGRRLPTEAEWEKASRGTDGRKYPWGKREPTHSDANYGRKQGKTCPVGNYPKTAAPYGHLDMAGNVWEWCEDTDDPYFYLQGPNRNPRITITPKARQYSCVVRGGSWVFDAQSLRTYARSSFQPEFRLDGVGFRCAL